MSFKCERYLVEAIEQFNLRKIMISVKHGHNIHVQNKFGQNLLIHLLKQQNYHDPYFETKRLNIFQFLITQCHADTTIVDFYNKNLFNWASHLNCTQEAFYLLQNYSGDVDMLKRDHAGSCSLHYAIEHGNEALIHAMVDYLLQYYLRFDIKDRYNNTPEQLARKLGYDHIADYLSEACRSTLFMTREITFLQQRTVTNRLKTTTTNRSKTTATTNKSKTTTPPSSPTSSPVHTKQNIAILSSLLSSTTIPFDPSEAYFVIESKIELAKKMNDWKTVAALRTYTKNLNERTLHRLPMPTLQTEKVKSWSAASKLSPITRPFPLNETGHVLTLLEPQICSSYRQPFTPNYPKLIAPISIRGPPSVPHRKMSVSSRRMSSVMSVRKRDSVATQSSMYSTQDGSTRLSVLRGPRQYKQPNS